MKLDLAIGILPLATDHRDPTLIYSHNCKGCAGQLEASPESDRLIRAGGSALCATCAGVLLALIHGKKLNSPIAQRLEPIAAQVRAHQGHPGLIVDLDT